MSVPELTDRKALNLRRLRARTGGAPFLHETARREIEERLEEVNRAFTAPLIVTGRPDIWADLVPGARVVADDPVLAADVAAHDLVIHAMALHWADDPLGQIVQCRRALRPDGLFIGVVFGGRTLHELRRALAEAESRIRGGLSPRVAPMAEIRDLGGLLQRAGLALPVADTRTLPVTYAGLDALVRDLRAAGETNALAGRERRAMPRRVWTMAEEIYRSHFPAGSDRISATFELVFLTGWAPAPGQQEPLRPGSASARLADALGTEERSAGDRAGGRSD